MTTYHVLRSTNQEREKDMAKHMYITESQMNAYRMHIIGRWKQHQALLHDYTVINDDDSRGDMIGIWVGPEEQRTMFIGIETDGNTHT